MADSDKDILITPQTSQTSDPTINFKSGATSGDPITLSVTDDGTTTTLDFSGSAGQLFSISNDLTGTLFAVSDSSGIPIIEADADGEVRLAEFGGNVGIGSSAPTHKLHLISDEFTGARIERTGAGGGIGVQFKNGDANIWSLGHGGDEVFRFSYNGTDYATLTNAGVLTASSFSGTVATSNLSGDLPSGVDPYITATSTNASYRMVFRDTSDATGNSPLFNDTAANFYYNPSTNILTVPTVSGSLSGTATNATNINVLADNSTNATHYVIFTGGASGNVRPNSDTGLTYNPSTNTLTTTTFAGTATNANNIRVDADNTTNSAHYLTFVGSAGSGSVQRLNTDTGLTYNPSSGLLDMQDGSRLAVNRIDTANNQHLVLNAGESGAYATGQTNEFVYVNAESGLQIISSPDNWDAANGGASAWANRNTAVVINASDGSSTFNDVIVSGNLTVNGATVTNSATNTTIEDALIELGSGNTGANSNDLGLILERGTTGNNVFIGWDESADKVRIATTTNTGAATGGLTLADADFQANNITARTVFLQNLEKSNLTTDGQLGFDSSQGLLVYRTQQGTSGATTTVLDGWNVAAGTYISISNLGTGGTGTEEFTFSHDNTTRTNTTSTAQPTYGATFTAIDSVTTNTQGHVTAVNTKTVTIPASDNTNSVDYINSASFNTGNGIITLSGVGNAGATVDIDGRFVNQADTRLGLTTHSLVDFTAVGDYDKPAGYQTMMRGTSQNASVVGTPVAANYWLYNVMAKRDTAGGTAAIMQNYDNGDFYVGFTSVNTSAPTWRRTYLDTDFTTNTTGPNSTSTTASRTYLVQRNSSDNTQLVVNVPWSDTNTNTTNFNVQANGGTQVNISAGEEVNFINGTITTAAVTNQANPTVTFNHNNVSRTNNTSTAQPAYGGTFTAIDSITTSSQGHVTAVNTKTVTIPASDNTNTTYSAGDGLRLDGTTFNIEGNEIPGSVDLNTYRTTGTYPQNANSDALSGSNYPVSLAGILQVINDDFGNGLHTAQLYSQYNSTNLWHRTYYNGTWQSWRNLAQDTDTVYSLPLAANGTRGGVQIGYTENGKNYPVELASEKMFVNVPWTDTVYSLPTAAANTLGGIEVGFTTNSGARNYAVQLSGNDAYVNVPWTDTTNFIPLTGSSSITGALSTTGTSIEVGRGSGSVAMTTNDGDGNANLTFNHKSGDADIAGNVGRIEVNVDSTTGAAMHFEISNNNATGAIVINNTGMTLTPSTLTINSGSSGGGQLVAGDLTLTALSAQNSEATALVIDGSNIVGTRELSSAAFTASTNYLRANANSSTDVDGRTVTVLSNAGDVVLGGSGTIAGGTWANGSFHLGTATAGWAMDTNEFYNSGQGIIGTLSGDITINPAGILDINGSVSVEDGSAASPSVYFGSDSNTGFYHPTGSGTADFIGIATGGTVAGLFGPNGIFFYEPVDFNGDTMTDAVLDSGSTGIRFEQGGWMYDSGGDQRLFFGATHTYYKTSGTGGKHFFFDTDSTLEASADAFIDAGGNGHFAGNVVAYSTQVSSDIRLKENIRPIESATDTVKKLNGVIFDWKKTERGIDQLGFIAQEVEEVIPSLVLEVDTLKDETETHKTVNYAALVPMLVESIKEQAAQIETLTKRIEELENGNH